MTAGLRHAIRSPAAASSTLPAWADLLDRWHAAGIPYCHWKSNEHLAAALAGETDLDLLVDRAAAPAAMRLLHEAGFKLFKPLPGRGYPGVDDWIGLSASTGQLLHAHVHYQLTVGEPFLKGYRLPWESVVLTTRQWEGGGEGDAGSGIYVADPSVEFLLHVVRAALKVRLRDRLWAAFGRQYACGGVLREFRWLARLVMPGRLRDIAIPLVGAGAAETLVRLAGREDLPLAGLAELRARAVPRLSSHRMYAPFSALIRAWLGEVRARAERLGRRWMGRAWSRPRTPPAGGLTVAVVGGDGSGKSTVTRIVSDWLARQAVVFWVYGGSGSGPGSLLRRGLERARALVPVAPSRRPRRSTNGGAAVPAGLLRTIWRGVWALALARERHVRARAAYRARSRGAIVIWDRLPQTQFPRVNDGPYLAEWSASRSAVARWAASREHRLLRAAEAYAPDLVVKLHVSHRVGLERKPDTPPDRLREKLEVTRRLTYPTGTRVLDVDADRPLEQVLLDVQRAIWEAL